MFVFQAIFGPVGSDTKNMGIEQMIATLKDRMKTPMEGEANLLAPKILSLIATRDTELAKLSPDRKYLGLLEKQIRMFYNYVKELREAPEGKKGGVAGKHIPGLKENEQAITAYKEARDSGFLSLSNALKEKKPDNKKAEAKAGDGNKKEATSAGKLKGEDDQNLSAALNEIDYILERGSKATPEDKKRLEARLEKVYGIADYFFQEKYSFESKNDIKDFKFLMKLNGLEGLSEEDANFIKTLKDADDYGWVKLGNRNFRVESKNGKLVAYEELDMKDVISSGRYDIALKTINDVCKQWFAKDHLAESAGLKAEYYTNANKYDMAAEYATQAIKLNPKDANAYNARGDIYYYNSSWGRAIADYTKAIELNSEGSLYYSNRGEAYLENKEYGKAIADFKTAKEQGGEPVQYIDKRIADAIKLMRDEKKPPGSDGKTTGGASETTLLEKSSTQTSGPKFTTIPLDALGLKEFIDDFSGKFGKTGYQNKNALLIETLTYLQQSKKWLDAGAKWTGKDATASLEALKGDAVKMALVKEAFALAYGRGAANMKASLDKLPAGTDASGALAAFTDGTVAKAMTTSLAGTTQIPKKQMDWWTNRFKEIAGDVPVEAQKKKLTVEDFRPIFDNKYRSLVPPKPIVTEKKETVTKKIEVDDAVAKAASNTVLIADCISGGMVRKGKRTPGMKGATVQKTLEELKLVDANGKLTESAVKEITKAVRPEDFEKEKAKIEKAVAKDKRDNPYVLYLLEVELRRSLKAAGMEAKVKDSNEEGAVHIRNYLDINATQILAPNKIEKVGRGEENYAPVALRDRLFGDGTIGAMAEYVKREVKVQPVAEVEQAAVQPARSTITRMKKRTESAPQISIAQQKQKEPEKTEEKPKEQNKETKLPAITTTVPDQDRNELQQPTLTVPVAVTDFGGVTLAESATLPQWFKKLEEGEGKDAAAQKKAIAKAADELGPEKLLVYLQAVSKDIYGDKPTGKYAQGAFTAKKLIKELEQAGGTKTELDASAIKESMPNLYNLITTQKEDINSELLKGKLSDGTQINQAAADAIMKEFVSWASTTTDGSTQAILKGISTVEMLVDKAINHYEMIQ